MAIQDRRVTIWHTHGAGTDLYFGSCDGSFYSLDAITGELKWKYDTSIDGIANEFHSEPIVTTDVVIAGGDLREEDALGHIYAFDRNSGAVRWKYDLKNGIAGTILTQGSKVYAMSFQQSLIGLDIASGRLITPVKKVSGNANFIFPASPVIQKDRIFYAEREGSIFAIRADNHDQIWSNALSEQITSDVTANRESIFVSTEGKKIYEIAQETGKITRTFSTGGVARWKLLSIADGLVFLEWNDSNIPTLKSLNITTGKEQWSQPSPAGSEWDTFRPLQWKNFIIVGSSGGHLTAFDSASGETVWSTKVEGRIRMLGASDHFVYAGCSNGFLYALLPQS